MTGFDSSDYKLAREDNTFLQLPTMSVDEVIYTRAIKSTAYRLPALHSSGKSTSDTAPPPHRARNVTTAVSAMSECGFPTGEAARMSAMRWKIGEHSVGTNHTATTPRCVCAITETPARVETAVGLRLLCTPPSGAVGEGHNHRELTAGRRRWQECTKLLPRGKLSSSEWIP